MMVGNISRRTWMGHVGRAGAATALAGLTPRMSANPFMTRSQQQTRRLLGLADASVGRRADPAGMRMLAMRAIEAATAAGARYADVRLTRLISETFNTTAGVVPEDQEVIAVGVRALIDGCWGFAARSDWALETIPAIAAEAVRQAKANAAVNAQHWDLAPTPVENGDWQPPWVTDPFLLSPEEKWEQLEMIAQYVKQYTIPTINHELWYLGNAASVFTFTRIESALATSEGSYCTQRRYTVAAEVRYEDHGWIIDPQEKFEGPNDQLTIPVLELTGRGWEACDPAVMRERIDAWLDDFFHGQLIPRKRVQIGRYDLVCSAKVAAQLVGQTLGAPLELDRIMGFEANASGTSYLTDPLANLGTLTIGSPLLTVTGNRTDPGGLATVRWDDEGVVPESIPFVTAGTFNDCSTSRQSASWLSPYYHRQGRPLRSHGCAAADTALSVPLVHPPNLALQPHAGTMTFEDIVRGTQHGLAILGGTLTMDFQGYGGVIDASQAYGSRPLPKRDVRVREIVNGKLGALVDDVGVRFDTLQLWKNLVELGGPSDVQRVALGSTKGQPEQSSDFTVAAVPIKLTNVAIMRAERL